MIDIDTLTMEGFRALPIVVEGESKEVRYAGKGNVVIRLKPTVYSYTYNRTGIVGGSDVARLRAVKKFLEVLRSSGVAHTYRQVNDRWILSQLVLQPVREGEPQPFRPIDLTAEQMAKLPIANPIEVIVKRYHGGTPKHRYDSFTSYLTRTGEYVVDEGEYPDLVVRFDWRNPMHNAQGERLADEVLPDDMAEWFIDTAAARQTVLGAFEALSQFLTAKGLELRDICFFVSTDGHTLFGEVSPDGMRVRDATGNLDKDIWRAGGSSKLLLEKWQQLADIVEK